jgi:predicted transcriptional regulator
MLLGRDAIVGSAKTFKEKWCLTQEQLAQLLGVTRSTVSHWLMHGGEETEAVKRQVLLLDSAFTLLEQWRECREKYPELLEIFEASSLKRIRNKKPPQTER